VGFRQPGSWREALEARAAYPGAKLIWGGSDVIVELDFDRERPVICLRDRILETFADHYSPSVQNTSTAWARRCWIGRFGMKNEGEIFHASSGPYGLIEGTVQRQG
jgi:urate oxidase